MFRLESSKWRERDLAGRDLVLETDRLVAFTILDIDVYVRSTEGDREAVNRRGEWKLYCKHSLKAVVSPSYLPRTERTYRQSQGKRLVNCVKKSGAAGRKSGASQSTRTVEAR